MNRVSHRIRIMAGVVALIMVAGLCRGASIDPRDDNSPWGIASGAEWSGAYPQFNPLLSDAGVRWLRWFPGWFSIEKKQGEWNWQGADALVANARTNKIHISGVWVFFPPWAAADGKNPRACPVKDIKFWSEYVSQSVNRYKDDIKYWEIWNEFNGGGFAISKDKPKDYAEMTVAAYDAAKAVDPTCMIGISCANFDLNFLNKVIKAGASNHFDFVCVHPYENLGEVQKGGGEPGFLSMVESLRKMLADNGQNVNMPLWITEIGFQAPVKPDAKQDALQADTLVKAYILSIAQGFSKLEWFEARGPQYGRGTDHGIIRADWSLRPAYSALKLMSGTLGLEPNYSGWLKVGGEGYGFLFENKGTHILAAWAPTDAGLKVKFPGAVRIVDLAGTSRVLPANTEDVLTRSPVFIVDLPSALVQEGRGNKSRKFPWGGDFSGQGTVSCPLGMNVEKGLRLTNPENVTIVNALDHTYASTLNDKGKTPHHLSFRAHHTYVADSPRELEITMVAKRMAPDKKAQTRIYFYESINGYKPTGSPWVIPEGDEWQEHSWTVTDANFVGQWGYNFCFEMQGPSPFLIKEVRVRKITPAK